MRYYHKTVEKLCFSGSPCSGSAEVKSSERMKIKAPFPVFHTFAQQALLILLSRDSIDIAKTDRHFICLNVSISK